VGGHKGASSWAKSDPGPGVSEGMKLAGEEGQDGQDQGEGELYWLFGTSVQKQEGLGLLDHSHPLTQNPMEGQRNQFFWLDGERRLYQASTMQTLWQDARSETI
jgi:hypothetical protein